MSISKHIQKRNLSLLLSLVFFSVIYSQENSRIVIDQTGSVNPWSHLEINNDPDNFQFAIVTDRTGGHRPGIFEDAVKKLNLLQPEFVMSVGDLIEGYTRDKKQIYREWQEFNGFISKLEMPFFYVPGNHDYINDVMSEIWEEKFGRSYYHFVYRDVLFLCLNSEEATRGSNMGGIEKPQYNYIRKVLRKNPDVRWTLVFMHQPLWVLDNTRYWPEVENLLKDREHTVFVGHHHHYVKYQRNNGKYFMLATTGGTSRLRGPDFGEFDHVVWITMTEEGPVIANLMLEGIWDEDIVNEEISRIVKTSPLRFEPLLSEENKFKNGSQVLKIINDENVPMSFKLNFEADCRLNLKNKITGDVPPNNVEIIELNISSEEATDLDEILTVNVLAEFSYQVNNDRSVDLVQNYRFKPVLPKPVVFLNNSPDFNNSFSKTGKLKYSCGNIPLITGDTGSFDGLADINAEFDLAYDSDSLYLFVKVTDDYIILDPDKPVRQQDGVRIYIDTRPLLLSISGREEDPADYIGLFLSPASSAEKNIIINRPERVPEGVKVRSFIDKDKRCHNYAVSVPLSVLDNNQGGEWDTFRLNIGATDVDPDGSMKQIWWQPEWKSENNIIGSGIFSKN